MYINNNDVVDNDFVVSDCAMVDEDDDDDKHYRDADADEDSDDDNYALDTIELIMMLRG